MFWRLALATCSRLNSVAKIACFTQIGQFFETFGFSLELLWLFIVFPNWTSLKPTVLLTKIPIVTHHFHFNLQEKGMGFLFFLSISCSLPWTSWFVSCYWDLRFIDEYGWIWVFAVWVVWVVLDIRFSLCLWLHKCVICSTHTFFDMIVILI